MHVITRGFKYAPEDIIRIETDRVKSNIISTTYMLDFSLSAC